MSSLIDGPRSRSASARSGGRRPRSTGHPALDPDQVRTLLTVAFRASAMALLLISAVVVVVLVTASSDLTGTLGAVATTWLAIHQVPATISGVQLGVLPLLPTVIMMWVVARRCASAASRSDTRETTMRLVGAAVAGPLTVTAIALVVIADASAAIPLSSPHTLAAFAWVAGIHLISASIGVVAAHWGSVAGRLPRWASAAIRPAVAASTALLAAGALAVVISLLTSWSTTGDLLARGDGFVGVLGLTLVSLLYLPNLIVGAAAVLSGSTAQFGDVSVSLFGNVGGDLPPLPLLGAVPDGLAGGLWPVLLVIPAAIGGLVGHHCARRIGGQDSLLAVVAAAAGGGVVMALLAVSAGGHLGRFGTVEVSWWAFGLVTFAWWGLFGTVAALIATWFAHRQPHEAEPAADRADDTAHEHEPEPIAAITVGTPSTAESSKIVEAEIVDDEAAGEPVQVPAATQPDAPVVEAEVVEAEVVEVPDAETVPQADLPSTPEKSSD